MIEITANLGLLFLTCVLFSVLYWQIVYPVILRRLRFKLFAIRDEIRRVGAERNLAETPAYGNLEDFICGAIRFLPAINITSFMWFALVKHKQFKEEVPPPYPEEPIEFDELRTATARTGLMIMALNSPWMIFLSVGIALICFTLGTITRLQIYRDTEDFVEIIPEAHGVDLQVA